jgi:hypothetical protein
MMNMNIPSLLSKYPFSKEYIETHFPDNIEYISFSFEDEFKTINEGEEKECICIGYNIRRIRIHEGKKVVVLQSNPTQYVYFEDYLKIF